MFKDKKVTVIIPAYDEENLIKITLSNIPSFVDYIIAINDCSTDKTLKMMNECAQDDSRIIIINHEYNKGVGGAIISGFNHFVNSDSNMMVIMAGDNQMDPYYLPTILDPLVSGTAEIVKGNRLGKNLSEGMSLWRLSGNVFLTFLTKIATGYYNIRDPQNGYVGASKEAISSLDFRSLYNGYVFENDFMLKAKLARLRMINVDIPARYGIEKSGIVYTRFIGKTSLFLVRSFLSRIRIKYLVIDSENSSMKNDSN